MKLLLIQFAEIKFIMLIYELYQMLTFKAQADTVYLYLSILIIIVCTFQNSFNVKLIFNQCRPDSSCSKHG